MSNFKQLVKQSATAQRFLSLPIAARRAYLRRKWGQKYDVALTLAKFGRSDVWVYMPEFDGMFQLGAKSALLHRFLVYQHYEPALSRIFLQHIQPDRDVIDVGANVGFYSVGSAKKLTSGKVLAVEPTTSASVRLHSNIEANGVAGRVICEKAILIDREAGEMQIRVIPDAEEYSSLSGFKHSQAAGRDYVTENVEATTLDALVRRHNLKPKSIKIDVEGAELKVLRGAVETITEFKPYVLSECVTSLLKAQGATPSDLFDIFYRNGYKVINPEAPGVRVTGTYQGDIFCIPPGQDY